MNREAEQRPPYQLEQAIQDIYTAAHTGYWPKFFEQWTVTLIQAGYEEAEVYSCIDHTKSRVVMKVRAQQELNMADVLSLAALITRYRQDLNTLSSDRIH